MCLYPPISNIDNLMPIDNQGRLLEGGCLTRPGKQYDVF